MELDNLSDQEKSVMLARAMGWEFSRHECGEPRWSWADENGQQVSGSLHDDVVKVTNSPEIRVAPMLYSEANMALAWRVLNWWRDTARSTPIPNWLKWLNWLQNNSMWMFDADKAQRAWLDKVLELAIEAGLVEAS